jgi:hypothetical protein
MIAKIFKGVWFLSLLATMAILLYVYASLPETLTLGDQAEISRSAVFYSALALLAAFNVSVFIVARLSPVDVEYFMPWFYGLIIFLHLLIIVSLQYLNLYNSQEKFNYSSIGFIIYGSIALVVLWSSLWPAYYLLQKFAAGKPAAGENGH